MDIYPKKSRHYANAGSKQRKKKKRWQQESWTYVAVHASLSAWVERVSHHTTVFFRRKTRTTHLCSRQHKRAEYCTHTAVIKVTGKFVPHADTVCEMYRQVSSESTCVVSRKKHARKNCCAIIYWLRNSYWPAESRESPANPHYMIQENSARAAVTPIKYIKKKW